MVERFCLRIDLKPLSLILKHFESLLTWNFISQPGQISGTQSLEPLLVVSMKAGVWETSEFHSTIVFGSSLLNRFVLNNK